MSLQENRPIFLTGSGSCAEIVINAPARRNALSMSMWSALPVLVRTVDADTAAKVLVIHGGSAGHFAAGVDISEFETIRKKHPEANQISRPLCQLYRKVKRSSARSKKVCLRACKEVGIAPQDCSLP